VKLEFSTNRLTESSISLAKASCLFGVPIGRKYIQRVLLLRAVEKFNSLFGMQALRLHPLKGNRAGQYSIILTGNYRLFIEKVTDDTIRIVAVEDYHGD